MLRGIADLIRSQSQYANVANLADTNSAGVPYCRRTVITTAELLALNTTVKELVPAPGAGKVLIPTKWLWFLDYNSVAYDGIAATEDIAVRYTNSSGQVQTAVESIGFLDQTADTLRATMPASTLATAVVERTPVANAALVAHMSTGNIATGNSDLIVWTWYNIATLAG